MSTHHFPADVDVITPAQFRDFLKRKGWRDREHRNKNLMVMDGTIPDTQHKASLVLPVDPTMDDYPARLRDALITIAEGFAQTIPTLVDAILHWDRDIYRIRLQSPAQREQLLPLECAAQVIAKYRDFIAFAAATQASPRRFFAKLTGANSVRQISCYSTSRGQFS